LRDQTSSGGTVRRGSQTSRPNPGKKNAE
jgi:hypothetical protein